MPLGVPVSPAPPGSLLSATAVTDTVGGGIVAVSATSPAVLTFAADHGLQSGSTIVVAGTATTPTTVGAFVATVVSSNQVSIPVAVASVATGTGTATVKALQQQVGVANFPTTQPVSGSVSVSNLPATQPVSGTVGVSNFPATQPVSAASLPLPANAAQDGTDGGTAPSPVPTGGTGIRGWLASIVKVLQGGIGVTGTFWQATQPVNGTFWQATQPVSGTVTANAGTNMSTAALALETGNLATIVTNTGKIPALGQAAMASSVPVAIANNQGAVPISAASLPLPTGALAAAQLPGTLGQKNMAGSASVTLASDQSAVPTTLATAPALVASEAHIGALGGATVAVSGSVTRPANTTAYAAGQVVGTASTDVITIAGAARKVGGSGVILDALIVDQGGAAASAALELYLFSASPTVQADQAAFALVAADLAALVAVVPVGSSYVTNVAATISGSRAYPVPGVNAGFVCAGGSTTLYGVLVQRSAYTPVSAESWTLILQISQD